MLACPRCGSRSVRITPHWLTAIVLPFTGRTYVTCGRCRYHGWTAQTERLDSERRRRGHSRPRRHGRRHAPDSGGTLHLSLDPTVPSSESDSSPGRDDDRGEPDLSALDRPSQPARVSTGAAADHPPAGEVRAGSRHAHHRQHHRHGSPHRRNSREGSARRVILLVVFVVGCVTAVAILARACGPEPRAGQLPAATHRSGVYS